MAANDTMAIGVLRVAQEELGLRVPEDLTVVGADDIQLTTYVRPRLTTISQPIYDIGRMATELLLEAIERKSLAPEVRMVPTRLVIRESSGPPPAGQS
jgi:LacI family transcriptional regulator